MQTQAHPAHWPTLGRQLCRIIPIIWCHKTHRAYHGNLLSHTGPGVRNLGETWLETLVLEFLGGAGKTEVEPAVIRKSIWRAGRSVSKDGLFSY